MPMMMPGYGMPMYGGMPSYGMQGPGGMQGWQGYGMGGGYGQPPRYETPQADVLQDYGAYSQPGYGVGRNANNQGPNRRHQPY